MYWNRSFPSVSPCRLRLIETWDVLKRTNLVKTHLVTAINRNMRCIETKFRNLWRNYNRRLIETWDVLKLITHFCPSTCAMINRNMRCIETSIIFGKYINCLRLIETWDVLKLFMQKILNGKQFRLIETWDVLKRHETKEQLHERVINRNMRCIETCTTCYC